MQQPADGPLLKAVREDRFGEAFELLGPRVCRVGWKEAVAAFRVERERIRRLVSDLRLGKISGMACGDELETRIAILAACFCVLWQTLRKHHKDERRGDGERQRED